MLLLLYIYFNKFLLFSALHPLSQEPVASCQKPPASSYFALSGLFGIENRIDTGLHPVLMYVTPSGL